MYDDLYDAFDDLEDVCCGTCGGRIDTYGSCPVCDAIDEDWELELAISERYPDWQ